MKQCEKCVYDFEAGSVCKSFFNCDEQCPMFGKSGCKCLSEEEPCSYFKAEKENESHD